MSRGILAAVAVIALGLVWTNPVSAAALHPSGRFTVWATLPGDRWAARPARLPAGPVAVLPWSERERWLPGLLARVAPAGSTRHPGPPLVTLVITTQQPAATAGIWARLTAHQHPRVALWWTPAHFTPAYRFGGVWRPWQPTRDWNWLPRTGVSVVTVPHDRPLTCPGAPPPGPAQLTAWSWRPGVWTWTYEVGVGGYVTCSVPAPPLGAARSVWRTADAVGPLRAMARAHPRWLQHWWSRRMAVSPTLQALLVVARIAPPHWGGAPIAMTHPPSAATLAPLRLLGWGPALRTVEWSHATPQVPTPSRSPRLGPWAWGVGAGLCVGAGMLWDARRRRHARPRI